MSNNTITPESLLVQMRAMADQARGLQSQQAGAAEQGSFTEALKQAVNAVSDNQQQASRLSEAFQKGDPNVQLSEVMLSLQKADVSFQAMVEVRNRLVSAYQEIMNMQI